MGLFNDTKGKHPCQLFAFRYLFSSQNTDEETSVESSSIILGQDAPPEPATINDDTTAKHATSENIKVPLDPSVFSLADCSAASSAFSMTGGCAASSAFSLADGSAASSMPFR